MHYTPLHYPHLILYTPLYTPHATHTRILHLLHTTHTLTLHTVIHCAHPYTIHSHTLHITLHYMHPSYTTYTHILHIPQSHPHTPLACCTHILSYFLRVHWLCPSSETLASLGLAAKDHMIWTGSQKLLMVFEGSATACFILFCV